MEASFTNAGKKEKDPNDSLNKSQDEGKPAGDGDDSGKGGLFKRVSSQSSTVDQHDSNYNVDRYQYLDS